MNKKKTIIAAIVLLLVLLVGGAIAYFTDTTEKMTNTFTIGKVDIELTEPTWTSTGKAKAESIMPGDVIEKDPTVKVATDSEDAWVFIKIEVPCLNNDELFTYVPDGAWAELTEATDAKACPSSGYGVATHVYGHTAFMTKNDTATLFSTVTFANITDGDYGLLVEAGKTSLDIPVTAYAIQKDNVAGATDAVWNANFTSGA